MITAAVADLKAASANPKPLTADSGTENQAAGPLLSLLFGRWQRFSALVCCQAETNRKEKPTVSITTSAKDTALGLLCFGLSLAALFAASQLVWTAGN